MRTCEKCVENMDGQCYGNVFQPVPINQLRYCKHSFMPFGKHQHKLIQTVIESDPEYIIRLLENAVEEPLTQECVNDLQQQIPLMIDDMTEQLNKKLQELQEIKQKIFTKE